MPAIRRARHKQSDVRVVTAALDDPRISQERVKIDVRRRIIVGDNADLVLSSCPLDVMYDGPPHRLRWRGRSCAPVGRVSAYAIGLDTGQRAQGLVKPRSAEGTSRLG